MSAAVQLELAVDPAPRAAHELHARLRALGLRDAQRVVLTSNRSTMVSFHAGALRVHRGYLAAPRDVHAAIVRLVQARRRAERNAARRTVLAWHVPAELSRPRRPRAAAPLEPRDARAIQRLQAEHAALNDRHFGGALPPVEIRLSAQMRSRLGHYSPAQGGAPPHIAIGRRHLRRHGWDAVRETLLHEMVHQWQDVNGLPLDHRARFKAKAREVGLSPTPHAPPVDRRPLTAARQLVSSLHSLFGRD